MYANKLDSIYWILKTVTWLYFKWRLVRILLKIRVHHFIVSLFSRKSTTRFKDSPNMPSVSPERDNRPLSQEKTRSQSPSRSHSPPRRSISPRSASGSRTPARTFSDHGEQPEVRNGVKNTHRSRSPSRSGSPSGARRRDRERSFSRSRSRSSPGMKSSKVSCYCSKR